MAQPHRRPVMKRLPPATDASPEALVRALARHGPSARTPSQDLASRDRPRCTSSEGSPESTPTPASVQVSGCHVAEEPQRTVQFPPSTRRNRSRCSGYGRKGSAVFSAMERAARKAEIVSGLNFETFTVALQAGFRTARDPVRNLPESQPTYIIPQFYTPIGGRDSTPFDDNANQPVGTNGTMPLDA